MSGFGILMQPDYIEPFPKEKIIAGYEDGQDAGIRHLVFQDQSDSGENATDES
jgi:hypothetical protein